MKAIGSFTTFLLIAVGSFGQGPREVTIKPGKDPAKSFPVKDKFRFTAFQDGYLITPQGKKSQPLLLNFNIFSGLPQFIDKKGDTLFLDKDLAQYVQIGSTQYVNHFTKDYYEIVLNSTPVKLAIEREWKISRVETVYMDHGRETTSLTRDKSNMIYSPTLSRMVRNENTVYEMDSSYFLVDAKGKVFKASESNAKRLFPHDKKQIEDFLRQEPVNFRKEQDLLRLVQFCNSQATK
jgi:hypothetical protein